MIFEKAFDTVDHPTLWKVLQEQGVPNHYIALLQSLYQGQIAYVKADVKSRSFSISRGVKQGDPISALLFIAVMQDCFGKLQSRWQDLNEKRSGVKYGIRLARGQLTNLRFADDVILVAQQRADIRKMLVDLQTFSRKYGLKIHLGKTKVMTWNALVCGSPFVLLGGDRVEILEETCSERYLGRKLCFSSSMETELNNRIAAGWATFHKHKGKLCSILYSTGRPCETHRVNCYTYCAVRLGHMGSYTMHGEKADNCKAPHAEICLQNPPETPRPRQ